ncbi:UNKNOWN [Stylonychia lemnae]|uniref:Uncharacterized protein n=1 Tax=Stylonychia lemnae TaxID=5949 RepID=A0A077ZWT2_STYLE|nr:UNKNOWN [Stylonychia lemnae]|eukprot:CDW72956.1 UNKNOWN [Stylonychia lemnae]
MNDLVEFQRQVKNFIDQLNSQYLQQSAPQQQRQELFDYLLKYQNKLISVITKVQQSVHQKQTNPVRKSMNHSKNRQEQFQDPQIIQNQQSLERRQQHFASIQPLSDRQKSNNSKNKGREISKSSKQAAPDIKLDQDYQQQNLHLQVPKHVQNQSIQKFQLNVPIISNNVENRQIRHSSHVPLPQSFRNNRNSFNNKRNKQESEPLQYEDIQLKEFKTNVKTRNQMNLVDNQGKQPNSYQTRNISDYNRLNTEMSSTNTYKLVSPLSVDDQNLIPQKSNSKSKNIIHVSSFNERQDTDEKSINFYNKKQHTQQLPLQMNFTGNQRSLNSTSQARSHKIQEQYEQYQRDTQKIQIEVEKEKIFLQNQLINTDIKSQERDSERRDRQRTISNDSYQQFVDLKNIVHQQAIQLNQKEVHYKLKMKEYKDRYKGKITEYKKYIEKLKVQLNDSKKQIEIERQQNQNINFMPLDNHKFYDSLIQALDSELEYDDPDIEHKILFDLRKFTDKLQIQSQAIIQYEKILEDSRDDIKRLEDQVQVLKKAKNQENEKQKQIIQYQIQSQKFERQKLSQKTLDITQRFDKLKNEIKKVQAKRMEKTMIDLPKSISNSPIVENRIKQLEQKERELQDREDQIKRVEAEQKFLMIDQYQKSIEKQKEEIQRLTVETQRLNINQEEESVIQNLKEKFDQIQGKLEHKNLGESTELKRDIDLIKRQLLELNEMSKQQQQQQSPIQVRRMQDRMNSHNSRLSTDRQSIEEQIKTRGFKLGMNARLSQNGYPVDSSACFDSLHDVCNHQIDELKKTLKHLSQERDQLIDQLEESRDMYQQALNEKMELEIHYNSKQNEVAYLHKYLDESEQEIRSLKQALEDQFNQMKIEIDSLEQKLKKSKDKKKAIEEKMELKELQQQQLLLMSSKENSSFYMGGLIGTPGAHLSHNQSISHDNTSQNYRRYQVDNLTDRPQKNPDQMSRSNSRNKHQGMNPSNSNTNIIAVINIGSDQMLSPVSANRNNTNQSSQSQLAQVNQLKIIENQQQLQNAASPNNTVQGSSKSQKSKPIRPIQIQVPKDDEQLPQRIHQNQFKESLLEQAENDQHYQFINNQINPNQNNSLDYDDDIMDGISASTDQQQKSGDFRKMSSVNNSLEQLQNQNQAHESNDRKIIKYEEMHFQSQSNHQVMSINQHRDSNVTSQLFENNQAILTPNSYLMLNFKNENMFDLQQNDIDIGNTFRPQPSTTSLQNKTKKIDLGEMQSNKSENKPQTKPNYLMFEDQEYEQSQKQQEGASYKQDQNNQNDDENCNQENEALQADNLDDSFQFQ